MEHRHRRDRESHDVREQDRADHVPERARRVAGSVLVAIPLAGRLLILRKLLAV
jgi:hypothetical protein